MLAIGAGFWSSFGRLRTRPRECTHACVLASRFGTCTDCADRDPSCATRQVTLQVCQQFSGVNAFVYFTPSVLKDAGVNVALSSLGITDDNAGAMASALLAYAPKLPFIFLASRLMDSSGRRRLLLVFVPLIALSLLGLYCALRFLPPSQSESGASGSPPPPGQSWRALAATAAIML